MICDLIARANFKPELEFQCGTSFQAGTSSYHALYKYENIEYLEVPGDHLYNTYESLMLFVLLLCTYSIIYSTPPPVKICKIGVFSSAILFVSLERKSSKVVFCRVRTEPYCW